ncbi:MAG: polysaccharide deacetylase family protein [Deltaproteobacteria bacterium]
MIRYAKKTLLYAAVFFLTGFCVWAGSLLGNGPDVTILMYHSIGPSYADLPGMGMSREAFARQMSFFKRHGYRVIRLSELIEKLKRNETAGPKTIVLTFDDGYEDTRANALPVLRQYGFPATVFLITDNIGRQVVMYDRPARFLSVAMMREMAASGLIDFGAHSADHAYLPDLKDDPRALVREIDAPKRFLEGLLGVPAAFFSYPIGGYTAAVRSRVRAAGYEAAVTTDPRRGTAHGDLFALKRVKIKGTEGPAELFFKTSGYYLRMKEMRP